MHADAATLRSLLQHKSVGMLPEGVAGCTQGACPKREAIYLSKRKGFIRIAIQASADLHALAFMPVALALSISCASLLCALYVCQVTVRCLTASAFS